MTSAEREELLVAARLDEGSAAPAAPAAAVPISRRRVMPLVFVPPLLTPDSQFFPGGGGKQTADRQVCADVFQ
jgi:hypothetical protein